MTAWLMWALFTVALVLAWTATSLLGAVVLAKRLGMVERRREDEMARYRARRDALRRVSGG